MSLENDFGLTPDDLDVADGRRYAKERAALADKTRLYFDEQALLAHEVEARAAFVTTRVRTRTSDGSSTRGRGDEGTSSPLYSRQGVTVRPD